MSVQDESWDRPYCNICCMEIKYGEKQNHGTGKCDSDSTHGGIKKIMKSKKINIDKDGLNSIEPTWLYPNQVNRDYEWAYTRYKKETGGPGVGNCIQNGFTKETMPTQDEFIARIKNDPLFAQRWGELRKGKCRNLQEQTSTKKNNIQMNQNNLTKEDAQKLQEIMTKVGLTIPQEVTNVLSKPELTVEEILCDCGLPCHPNTPCSEIIQSYNHVDGQYFSLLRKILTEGVWKGNRTGMDCLTIAGFMFEHDMSEGFPLLTSRKLPFKSTKVELEFFIKGLRSKKWLQDRGCHYWDGWCNPKIVPYANDEETKKKMAAEDDLGLIYGTQWRDFHDPESRSMGEFNNDSSVGMGVDQLKNLVNTLKTNPSDRRMIVSAWNPMALSYAALPSCHYGFQVTVIGDKLNLAWNQRSVDSYLGLPANISSYALLLHLLAKESGLKEGKLIGFLMDTHLYENHINQANELLTRQIHLLPKIKTDKFTSIFEWEYQDTELLNYKSSPPLTAPVSV